MIPGDTDLATLHPAIAGEAVDWDPSVVGIGGGGGGRGKQLWKCPKGHLYRATIHNRVYMGSGCNICANKVVQVGVNDLATTNPEIARQADGWDPTSLTIGSIRRMPFKCEIGHRWIVPVNYRTTSGCPFCANQRLLKGFNDLATTHPEIARQADGWDPGGVLAGSNKKARWRCDDGHEWEALISSRTRGPEAKSKPSGCPVCARYGFNPGKPAWLYLVEHQAHGLLQIGITNDPERRIGKHQSGGWEVLDIRGPIDGYLARALERDLLSLLRAKRAKMAPQTGLEKFDGWTEAWLRSTYPASDLKALISDLHQHEGALVSSVLRGRG